MTLAPKYLDAIRTFEGFTPKAAWDYQQNTNGYGTRAQYPGEVIDKDEAERRFQSEISNAASIVDRFAPNVDEGTKAALTSLTYNAGDAWTRAGLGDAIRSGDMNRARGLLLQYNRAGGEVLPGLSSRRAAEAGWIGNAGESQDGRSVAGASTPTTTSENPPAVNSESPALNPAASIVQSALAPYDRTADQANEKKANATQGVDLSDIVQVQQPQFRPRSVALSGIRAALAARRRA